MTTSRERSERIHSCPFQRPGANSSELLVESLQSLDKICEMFPRVHAPSGCAKMSAATKRPVSIHTAAPGRFQQRTSTIWMRLELRPSARSDAFSQIKSLPQGQKRCSSSMPKMAASAPQLAVTRQRPPFDLSVNSLDLWFVGIGIPFGCLLLAHDASK